MHFDSDGNIIRELVLTYQGKDSHERHVYASPIGRLYVDIELRKGHGPAIYTKYDNMFDGEPDTPLKENIPVRFKPGRITD